jgi:predicted RNA binding protein YcfA (HicA-like mRNA interferase family)
MNSKEVIRLLKEDGWVLKSQSGSHKQFVHPRKPGKVTVADHGKKEIPPGTFKEYTETGGSQIVKNVAKKRNYAENLIDHRKRYG